MIMLVIVLVGSVNYGRNGQKETKAKKKVRRAVCRTKCKVERKKFGNVLWRMIRDTMYLRL